VLSTNIRVVTSFSYLCLILTACQVATAIQQSPDSAASTPPDTVQGGGPRLRDGECETIFNNWNGNLVGNNGVAPTFTLNANDPNILCFIDDYHNNNDAGKKPGSIGLQDANGAILGPWAAAGTPGQSSKGPKAAPVPDANWRAPVKGIIGVPLQAKLRYTVIDTDLPSWSQNQQSANRGFTRVWVKPGQPT
jgi:hypothetical protein